MNPQPSENEGNKGDVDVEKCFIECVSEGGESCEED